MAYKGSWRADTAYVVGDTVDHRNEHFTCTVAHTSAAATEPDLGASWDDKWDRVGAADETFDDPPGGGGAGSLADGAVTTAKIAANAVTAAKVAADVATQAELDAVSTTASNHISDATAAHAAAAISFSPTGSIASTDVQAAIAEVASEAGGGGDTWLRGSKTWDPGNMAAFGAGVATQSTTVTVTGAAVGDMAVVGFSTVIPAKVVMKANVSAADTVTVVLINLDETSAHDLASGTLNVAVLEV